MDSDNEDYCGYESLTEDTDEPNTSKMEREDEKYHFEVLSSDEVKKHMVECIHKVRVVAELPETTTRILLNHCKWNSATLLERFYGSEQERLFHEAHIINPLNVPAPSTQTGEEFCAICFGSVPSITMTSLGCDHRFCTECWTEYLTGKIMAEGLGQSISCAAHDCKILVDDVTVMRLVTNCDVRARYQQLVTNSFVECNPLLRWCPSAGCNKAVKVKIDDSRPVTCTCGHTFCFGCGESDHDPILCSMLKKWIKKCNDDSETFNWLVANTKECPKCSSPIEKNGGCNHMSCRKEKCKFEFCWICLHEWKSHNQNYLCNRFKEDQADQTRGDHRKALVRYLHYYNRYMIHMQSLKFEHELYDSVQRKMKEMQQRNMTYAEVQYLKEAVDRLCRSRQTLMYTYVFAYYLQKNNQQAIFEDNQMDLESATEELSGYLERDVTTEDLNALKQKVLGKTKYCESRRKVLVDHVHEGYSVLSWDYIVNL